MSDTKTHQIKTTVTAYLRDPKCIGEFTELVTNPDNHAYLVGRYLVFCDHDMSKVWPRIGEAEITISIGSQDEQVCAAIKVMQGQIDEARSKFLTFQAEMLERINKLQALEMAVAEEVTE